MANRRPPHPPRIHPWAVGDRCGLDSAGVRGANRLANDLFSTFGDLNLKIFPFRGLFFALVDVAVGARVDRWGIVLFRKYFTCPTSPFTFNTRAIYGWGDMRGRVEATKDAGRKPTAQAVHIWF